MNVPRYAVQGRAFAADDPGLQGALAQLHGSAERPRCMCVQGGVDMYIAQHSGGGTALRYVLKRMPGSGNRHAAGCDSYEADYSQSGLGALMGEAVLELPDQQVQLRLAFQLALRQARVQERPAAGQAGAPGGPVKAAVPRMSLRAVLHYLLETAGLNRWYPAMAGKRGQQTLHKYLTEAAQAMRVGQLMLSERLLVPEAYHDERSAAQAARRRAQLAPLYRLDQDGQQLALFFGEIKDVKPCRNGSLVRILHMPELPLFVDEKTWRRIERVYAGYFAAQDAHADQKTRPRLLMGALAFARQEHLFQIDSACLILASPQFIPVDGPHELDLIAQLCASERRFVKPLRYDAPNAGNFANALLLDTGPEPTPLHVVSALVPARERQAKQRAIAESPGVWTWETDQVMPPLPAPVPYAGVPQPPLPGR